MTNDASYSSFGWNFQANAGILLFLKDIKNNVSVTIESRKQDIEITTKDGLTLAQAKSTTKNSNDNNINALKNALESLSLYANGNDKIIYICNFKDPTNLDKDLFVNNFVNYSYFSDDIKNLLNKIVTDLIQELQIEYIKAKKESRKRILNDKILHLQSFNWTNFYIYSIYPYFGDGSDRYNKIRESITDFLSNTLGFSFDRVTTLSTKLLNYWQNYFMHNSTIKDDIKLKKSINKSNFLWPIIVFMEEPNQILNKMLEKIGVNYEQYILDNVNKYIGETFFLENEKYEFYGKVISSYKFYKQKQPSADYINFINEEYDKFKSDVFVDENEYEDVHNLVTKFYMYNAVNRLGEINKIKKECDIL